MRLPVVGKRTKKAEKRDGLLYCIWSAQAKIQAIRYY